MKIHKRITAGVLAAALCATLPGIDSLQVLAEQAQETEETTETTEATETGELTEGELSAAVNAMYEGVDLQEAGEQEFGTKNLIVSTADENFDTLGAEGCLDLGNGLYALSYADEKSAKNAYETYQGMEGIGFVETDDILETCETENEKTAGTEEPAETNDTELKRYLDSLQESEEIKVAVLDTGIKADAGCIDRVENTGINLSTSGEAGSMEDDNGHGTDIAEIIAENSNGYVKILPVKIANAQGKATVLNAYLGIQKAMENDADIINISMNTCKSATSQILTDIINEASQKGIVVVVSAGNGSTDTADITPADIDSAVVVSAVNEDDSFADYSNYGETVDYCSYGTYEDKAGTSYAAANVTGIIADLLSKGQEVSMLGQYAIDLGTEGKDPCFGNGFIGCRRNTLTETEQKPEEEVTETDDIKKDDTEKENPDELEISAIRDGYTEYTSTSGYILLNVNKGTTKNKYKINISIPQLRHRGPQNVTTSVNKLSGNGDFNLRVSSSTTKEDAVAVPNDGENQWAINERQYIIPLKATVRKYTGYHIDYAWTSGIQSGIGFTTENSMNIDVDTNGCGLTNFTDGQYHYSEFKISYLINKYKVTYAKGSTDGGGTVNDTECTYNENVKLRSNKFTGRSYTITYNSQGGTAVNSTTGNLSFNKWRIGNNNYDANKTLTKPNFTATNNDTVTATAQWSSKTINITAAPTKTGYTFDGWYDSASGGNKVTSLTIAPKTTAYSKTLYAHWTKNQSTLNVNPNGGKWKNSTATQSFTKEYNKTLNIPVPTIPNYTATFDGNGGTADTVRKKTNKAFSSWTKSSTFYGTLPSTTAATTYTFGATNNVTSTITANWSGNYNITLPGATKTGYDLLGWSTSSSATKPDTGYTPGATVTVSANKTLYAVWKLKTYTITYNANGGTGTMEPGIKTYSDTYTIKKNAFIRSGYDFVGWSRTKEGPADPDYAEGEEYNTNADLTLYAQWRENFHPDYIGNEQTEGNDFIDEGKDGYGYSEDKDYSLNNEEEHFKKEETVTYKDSETGELVMQTVEGTVTGWSYKKNKEERNDENTYELGTVVHGTEFMKKALDYGAVSYGGPNEDFGTYPKNVLAEGIKTTYGAQQGAILQNLGVGTVYNGTPYVNLYADWDMGPVIEAYDRYYTLEEAQGGIITEDELLNAAKATDEELKSSTNPDGKLKNHEDAENGTSFVVYDYQAEEFTELNGSAVISVTYRAEDAAGNVTRKMIMVHIVDGHDTIIDGHDIGVDPDEGEVRFISEDYLDTLDEDSVWVNNPEYAALLEETVKIKRVDPERSEAPEALKAFGDKYTVAIPGTGTWTKEPKYVWKFTHEQTQEVKDFIEEHGPSNFVEEDALKTFLNEFADCMEQ